MKYLTPSVWKGFFLGFDLFRLTFVGSVVLLLCFSSCEETKVQRQLGPKIEDSPKAFSLEVEETTTDGRKVVYLNKSTFELLTATGIGNAVFLNEGVNKLLTYYSIASEGSQGEINRILEKSKPFLNQDYVDAIALNHFLVELKEVKSHHPKAKDFADFVDAIELASKKEVAFQFGSTQKNRPTIQTKKENNQQSDVPKLVWFIMLFSSSCLFFVILKIISKGKKEKPKPIMVDFKKAQINNSQEKYILGHADDSIEKFKEQDIRLQSEKNKDELYHIEIEKPEKKRIGLIKKRKLSDLVVGLQQHAEKEEAEYVKVQPIPVIAIAKTVIEAVKPLTTEIAYFSLPMNERIFSNVTRSPVPNIGATFYIFIISADGQTATFDFWNNHIAVEKAINKAHSHIDAACDILNDRDLKATHILTEESGFAELQGDKWIVKTKAKIKYLL
jgi:hypothetical protein